MEIFLLFLNYYRPHFWKRITLAIYYAFSHACHLQHRIFFPIVLEHWNTHGLIILYVNWWMFIPSPISCAHGFRSASVCTDVSQLTVTGQIPLRRNQPPLPSVFQPRVTHAHAHTLTDTPQTILHPELHTLPYLGDVCFDAFGQFDAWFSEELGQLVWDVLVFIQSIQ